MHSADHLNILPLLILHVGPQHLRYEDAAVRLLAVLENGHPGAAHGKAAAVQRVGESGLAFPAPHADVGPPGLEVTKPAAGADLPVGVLGGQPYFEVVGLLAAEAQVAGAEQHAAIGAAREPPRSLPRPR